MRWTLAKKGFVPCKRSSAWVYPTAALLIGIVFGCEPASAEEPVFYADPERGSNAGDGSLERPWKTLAEVAQTGRLKALESGGTLYLRSGDHGTVQLSGDNAGTVTIANEKGHHPRLSRLTITKGSRWTIRGLTITPSLDAPYRGNIVTLAEGGPASELLIEGCFIYSTLDTSSWTADDWINANSGILAGRHGSRLTIRNNHVLNIRFGIQMCAPDSLCEGNLVSDFSADGIRITRDGITVQHNVIKNGCCSAADGDDNHDDAIQCFLFNKGTGTVRNAVVRGNVIVNREGSDQQFPAPIQGIGFFDGPLVNFVVEDNVVLVDHWHGITLNDAQNCRINGNSVYSIWNESKARPWIMIGQKQNASHGNRVFDNMAFTYNFKSDPMVEAERNVPVSSAAFQEALDQALEEIEGKGMGRDRREEIEEKGVGR
ncbi:MAG: right-handed parallel beta-helix repeat-containing protein [Verrucomicrobiota bacterium]|nr:right-handed parallel beta-helix repeat-containing protein [Verrucomicrobiota bacterium]